MSDTSPKHGSITPNESLRTTIYPNGNATTATTQRASMFNSPNTSAINVTAGTKRIERDASDDTTTELRRKQSKVEVDEAIATGSTNASPRTSAASNATYLSYSDTRNGPETSEVIREQWQVEVPDWGSHQNAWAFLQSLNPAYQSFYLVKKDFNSSSRPGYLLGRRSDCDMRFTNEMISKTHCLIYMETGSTGQAKGIRIFLEDKSTNGTFVNGEKVVRRRILKNNDEIQLVLPRPDLRNDPKYKFFKVLFPPSFESDLCEQVYKLDKVLGKGNFASVFHATNRKNGQEVAIKVLQKSRISKKNKMAEAFVNEVSVLMQLRRHPLLVPIHKIYNEVSKIFLVLEYVPGGELFSYVVRNKKLDENTTRFIFWQLFNAIKYIHDNCIAHRDLKPENVLITDTNKLQIKITDFGLAKLEDRNVGFDSQCGTPNYVAPEILESSSTRAYNKNCDMWSLGVMLYICLCGFPPFSEDNRPLSMKQQIRTAHFSFPSPFWDDISEEAKSLITKLLVVDPEERLTAGDALADDWLMMEPEDMQRRRDKLGSETLNQIMLLREMGTPQVPTQHTSQVAYYD